MMTACAHCPVAVEAVSIGYVHTDTHNTHGADGHLAEAAFDAMMLADVPDSWKPVDLPLEVTPDTGVVNAPYAPVPAQAAIDARWGTPAHLLYLDAWEHMTPADRDAHVQSCDTCDTCDTHRAEAWCDRYGRQVTITDRGVCPDCGFDHLNEHHYDVKGSEL